MEGPEVGQRLARVRVVAQRVDHRDAAVARHLLDVAVLEDARGDDVHVAAEDAREVADGLALAELDFALAEGGRVAAELGHGHLERDARAQRRLLEEHAERLPLEDRPEAPFPRQRLLLAGGDVENLQDVLERRAGDADEMSALHARSFTTGTRKTHRNS